MPKLFYPYLILLSLVFLNCQGDLDEDFDHWDLINSDTKNIIFLNNINTGVQDLNLKENISSELSIPAFSPALNQLIDNLDIQTSGFLILNESDDPFNFYLVLKHKDLINEIKKTSIYTFDQDTIFRHHRGNYDIFSIDRELPAIKDNTPGFIPEALVKLFDLKKDKPVVVAKKITQVNESDLLSGSWIVYEYKSNNFGVSANGIILPKTEITYPKSKLANILKLTEGQRPTSLSSDQIIPSNFNSSISIAINNPESFNKIIKQADSSLTAAAFFETLQEINLIQIDKKTAIAVKSLDLNLSMKAFVSELTGQINFRGINIQRFQAKSSALKSVQFLMPQNSDINYGFIWNEYLVLCTSQDMAEDYIQKLQNNNILGNSKSWGIVQEQIAKESNILLLRKDIEAYNNDITQIIQGNGFAHFNFSFYKSEEQIKEDPQSQLISSIRFKVPLIGVPQFFSNYKTGGKNIIAQDQSHRLYYMDQNGKTMWYRDLEGPIIGKIQEVDLLRNGKKQLAFVTSHRLHIINIKGRDVAPFPKKFKDQITQPLAIFDYENNLKYRFVVVQNKTVLMYNSEGIIIKGFNYKKAATKITHVPVHLRINSKDYLLFCLENGQLDILSRTGEVRVPIKELFSFGPEPPIKKDGRFVLWTENGHQIQISPNGNILQLDAKTPSEYRLINYGPHTVEFDYPLLRIDQKLIELPLGRYLGPQVFNYDNKLYTVMIDQDTQSVYVYNSACKLISDGALFGDSKVDIAHFRNDNTLKMIVKGQADEILIYRLN